MATQNDAFQDLSHSSSSFESVLEALISLLLANAVFFVYQAVLVSLHEPTVYIVLQFFYYPIALWTIALVVGGLLSEARKESKSGRPGAVGGSEWIVRVMIISAQILLVCRAISQSFPSDELVPGCPYKSSDPSAVANTSLTSNTGSSSDVKWIAPYDILWLVGKAGFLTTLTGFCVLAILTYFYRTHQVSTILGKIRSADAEDWASRAGFFECKFKKYVEGSARLYAEEMGAGVDCATIVLCMACAAKVLVFVAHAGDVVRETVPGYDPSYMPVIYDGIYFVLAWALGLPHNLARKYKTPHIVGSWYIIIPVWIFGLATAASLWQEWNGFLQPMSVTSGDTTIKCTLLSFLVVDHKILLAIMGAACAVTSLSRVRVCKTLFSCHVFGQLILETRFEDVGEDGKFGGTAICRRRLPYYADGEETSYVHWAKKFRDDIRAITRSIQVLAKGAAQTFREDPPPPRDRQPLHSR